MTLALPARLRRVDVLVVLVAILAVVIRHDQEVAPEIQRTWGALLEMRWSRPTVAIVVVVIRVASDLIAALVFTTIALGLAALRRPRRPGRGRWPGRGWAAIVVGALVILNQVIEMVVGATAKLFSTPQGQFKPHFLGDFVRNCQSFPPHAILGAWTLLALAGRWHTPEAGFGQIGRLLGWCWLASLGFEVARSALW